MVELVTMNITVAIPPIFKEIVAVFPEAIKPGVLFCFGDTIYNPSGIKIPNWLVAHENVHRKQQAVHPGVTCGWWLDYLNDPKFRFDQELPAHIEEYKQFRIDNRGRNVRRLYLRLVAERLSGPLYGRMMTYTEARKLIKIGAKNG